VTPKQRDILEHIAGWAAKYPCIKAIHVFGSIARQEEKPTSDVDIAFEYVPEIESDSDMLTCYTNVNADWEAFAYSLRDRFGHLGSATGLFPPYDRAAWAAIRTGHEIGKVGKVRLVWTHPK